MDANTPDFFACFKFENLIAPVNHCWIMLRCTLGNGVKWWLRSRAQMRNEFAEAI